jgi:hypothetical protein
MWALTVGSTLLLVVGCGGSNDGAHEAQAAPPSMRGFCTSPGIRYLGKPVPGGAAVCFTLTRDRTAVREIGVGVGVTASQCGIEREDHWHWDFGAARARRLGAGGRINLELVFPVDPHYRPLMLLIRGSVRGANASGVISDKRSCYPRFRWAARRVSSAK